MTSVAHSTNLTYKSKDENLPSVISGQNDVHITSENQSSTSQKQMSESNIFNNIGSTTDLKYLHKKFKRVASAIIDENSDHIKQSFNKDGTSDRVNFATINEISVQSDQAVASEKASSESYANSRLEGKLIAHRSQKQQQLNEQQHNPALIDRTTVTNNTKHDSNLHQKDILLHVSRTNANSDSNFKYELSKCNLGANTVNDYLNPSKPPHMEQPQQLDKMASFLTVNELYNQKRVELYYQKLSTSVINNYNLSRIESVCPTTEQIQTNSKQQASTYRTMSDMELNQDKPTLYQSSSTTPPQFNQSTKTTATTAQFGASMHSEKNSTNISSCNNNNNGSASSSSINTTTGQYVCSFCHSSGTKPSFLRKHICTQSNERPYPCGPCGLAFKTRSNLHKHYRLGLHHFSIFNFLK